MGANSSYKAMYDIVKSAKAGTIFIPDDFAICGTPDAVRSGLSRLCRNGDFCRFAKGIYYIPIYDKWDGTLREPSLDDIALKIAQRDCARVIPTGAYALNKLGLSTHPRVIASNMAVSVEGGHMAGLLAYEAKDADDGRAYVRKIAETKPDLIKLMITGGVLDAEKEGDLLQ